MKLFYNQANEALQASSLKNRSSRKFFSGFVLLIVSLCFSNAIHAQTAPPIQWQKSLGGSKNDYAFSVQQTTDGGFIVAGYSESKNGDVSGNHGYDDYWIVRLDASGNIEWQKSLGGSYEDDAYSIQQTTDGGFIVAGDTYSNDGDVSGNHDVSGNQGLPDYWVVKLDANGNIIWQKCLGGGELDQASSIQETTDGGFIVAGSSSSNDGDVSGNHGSQDYWIVKLDANGNLVWQKSLGGSSYDVAESIQQTSDGGFIVAGYSDSNDGDVSGNHGGNGDYWIVKQDANGNIVWQKSLGGSDDDRAFSIQQITDGGFIIAGSSYSNDGDVSGNHGSQDYWIVKVDANGNLVWQKSLGGSSVDFASSIQPTTDGGFIVAGGSGSIDGDVSGNQGGGDYWVVKLNANGNIVWQKCLGGSSSDDAYSIQQTTDGGFIVAGASTSNNGDVSGNHGNNDYWVVKLSPEVQSCLGPANLSVTNITATSVQLNWTIEGTPEAFRISYHAQDGPIQIKRVAGTVSSVTLSNLTPGTIYTWNITAKCSSDLESSPAPGKRFETASNKEAAVNTLAESLSLYPNPTSGSFTINLQTGEAITTSATIQILNALALTIYNNEGMIDNGVLQKEIQLNDVTPGMYLVKITSNNRVYTARFNLQK